MIWPLSSLRFPAGPPEDLCSVHRAAVGALLPAALLQSGVEVVVSAGEAEGAGSWAPCVSTTAKTQQVLRAPSHLRAPLIPPVPAFLGSMVAPGLCLLLSVGS